MYLLRQFFRFFDSIVEETTPSRVAAGLLLGLIVGLYPLRSLHAMSLLLVAAFVRVQLPSVLLGWLVGAAACPWLDPFFNTVGLYILSSATLRSSWSWLYHAPVIPFTRFNNSINLGIYLVATVAAPALFVLFVHLLRRYWGTLATRIMYTPLWQHWHSGVAARYYRDYQEDSVSKPPAQAANKSSLLHRLVRVSCARYLGGAGLVVLVAIWFGRGALLKHQIEGMASPVIGARVNVGSVELNPLRGEIILTDIQLGNPAAPSRNLFQIARIRMTFLLYQVLRRKLIFDTFTVEGVRIGTEREESATLSESELYQGVAGLMGRSTTGYYSETRNALKTNPLKYLGSLSSGLSLNPRIDRLRGQLETLNSLERQDREIEAVSARWEAGKLNLPNADWIQEMRIRLARAREKDRPAALNDLALIRGEIAKSTASVTEIAGSFSEWLGSVQRGISSLSPSLDADVARVKEALHLPDFSMDDLTPQIFGGTVLSLMERVAYWIDLSRRRMPKGDALEKMTLVLKSAPRGTDAYFSNRSNYPELLIPEINFLPNSGGKEIGVTGKIYGLTSEPSFYHYPAGATIEADFPAHQVEKAKLTILVDHTSNQYQESLALTAQMLPLNRLVLHNTSSLALTMERSHLSLSVTARFEENQLKASWLTQIDNAQYTITSRYLPEETTLKRIINPIQTVQMTGSAEGATDQLHLQMQSNLGRQISAGLRHEFRHPLGAIDDNIRRSILDRAEPSRRALASRVSQLRHGAFQTVNRSLKDLQDLAAEADTLRGRLEHPSAKTAAGRSRPQK